MEGKCGVCSVECNKFCSNCKKVFYCSSEHQKKDRKSHKQICFPAVLAFDEVQGRHFVATRSISPGERIFSEKALVVGPNGAEKYFHKICLGCYRVVRSDYTCSKCQWPVCSPLCEKLSPHCDMECKVFAEKNVLPYFTKPYEYDFIKFLRSLLLWDGESQNQNQNQNESDKGKWDQLLQLASHPEARAQCESSVMATMYSAQFIHDVCHLDHFDYDTINHVVGVWGVNSFGANAPSGPNPQGRLASFLFAKTSLCSHSCVANTRGILMEEEERVKGEGGQVVGKKPVYSMELLASLQIDPGQPILITYADVGEGTFERRKILRDNYYFSCNCPRCSDPTEFNTYFSAFKCPDCTFGYLLPENPLDFDSTWVCDCSAAGESSPAIAALRIADDASQSQPNSHGNSRSSSDSGRGSSSNSSESGSSTGCSGGGRKYVELAGALNKIKFALNSVGTNDPESEIKCFERILREHSGKTLHKNHWILMEVTFRLVQRLICYMPEAKNVHSVIQKCVSLSQHCLHVADSIRPGHNSYRGKLLYCYCQARLQGVVRSSGMDIIEKRTSLFQLKSSIGEAREILIKEPLGSDERIIAESLTEDLTQVARIISVLDNKIKSGM